MANSIITRAKTAALVALASHGIPPDVQELLVGGDGRGSVPPGALDKMIRAALYAMREPSSSMLPNEGVFAGFCHDGDGLEDNHYLDKDEARYCWRSMVDAALAER